MSEEEKNKEEKWLEDHFFVKDDNGIWRLRYYDGLFINMERLPGGWRGSGSFCNGDGGIDVCGQLGQEAEETAMSVISALELLLRQLAEDLSVTRSALVAMKPSVEIAEGFVQEKAAVGGAIACR